MHRWRFRPTLSGLGTLHPKHKRLSIRVRFAPHENIGELEFRDLIVNESAIVVECLNPPKLRFGRAMMRLAVLADRPDEDRLPPRQEPGGSRPHSVATAGRAAIRDGTACGNACNSTAT